MGTGKHLALAAVPRLDGHMKLSVLILGNPARFGREQKTDPLRFQGFLKRRGNLLILPRNNIVHELYNSHFAAETTVHLAKFQANVAAADDDHMFWRLDQIHDVAVGQVGHVLDAFDGQNQGAGSRVDEDMLAGQFLVVNGDRVGAGKTSSAPQQGDIGTAGGVVLLAIAPFQDELVLALDNL